MELTAQNVTETLKKCLYETGEDTTNHVLAEGVRLRIGFNPDKLEEQKENIESMLNQLPNEFKKDGGGGHSFINACVTANGNQWGEHTNIDELLCLGLAIGKVKIPFGKEIWSALPGGLPYFVIN